MLCLCVDGALAGAQEVVRDDIALGDQVQLYLPVKPIEADEPIYHPFSDEARDRITRGRVTYIYQGDGMLRFCR